MEYRRRRLSDGTATREIGPTGYRIPCVAKRACASRKRVAGGRVERASIVLAAALAYAMTARRGHSGSTAFLRRNVALFDYVP